MIRVTVKHSDGSLDWHMLNNDEFYEFVRKIGVLLHVSKPFEWVINGIKVSGVTCKTDYDLRVPVDKFRQLTNT